MSRKAKLASMLAAAQAERDPFVEGSGALDALGGHVRELLVNCKTSEGFSEDVFKAALIQVKTQLQRCAEIPCPVITDSAPLHSPLLSSPFPFIFLLYLISYSYVWLRPSAVFIFLFSSV